MPRGWVHDCHADVHKESNHGKAKMEQDDCFACDYDLSVSTGVFAQINFILDHNVLTEFTANEQRILLFSALTPTHRGPPVIC